MQHSEHINELATALAKAQGEITGAKKDSENSFFSSKYADLAACWDACREPLSANGLSIVQTHTRGKPVSIEWETTDQKSGEVTKYKVDTEELVIVTTLFHCSGQWIRSELPMIPRDASPQGMGSATAYGRRYGLTAMVGVAQVDDDGNQSSGRTNGAVHKPAPPATAPNSAGSDKARSTALAMLAILDGPERDGDHDGKLRAFDALDYYDKFLARDNDLQQAAWKEIPVPKRNIWSALIRKAREAEKLDKASDPTRARPF